MTCACIDAGGAAQRFINEVDLSSYSNITRLGDDPSEKASKELESIRKAVESIAEGRSRIAANTYNADDREAQRVQMEEWSRRSERDIPEHNDCAALTDNRQVAGTGAPNPAPHT